MSKPCAFTNQSLIDHAKGSLEEANNRFNDNYYKVIGKRLGYDYSKVKEYVKDLILLHDLGKAAEGYQSQFDDNCKASKDPGFIYHEVGGALYVYKEYEIDDELLRAMGVLSILNHLNAIRGVKDLKVQNVRPEYLKLTKYGNVFLSNMGFKPIQRDYNQFDLREMLQWLDQINIDHGDKLKLYTLFLAPLLVGDNLNSAYSRQINKKRRFISLLEGGFP